MAFCLVFLERLHHALLVYLRGLSSIGFSQPTHLVYTYTIGRHGIRSQYILPEETLVSSETALLLIYLKRLEVYLADCFWSLYNYALEGLSISVTTMN